MQFSEAGVNGALMFRKKKTTQKTITDKKKWKQLSIAKVLEAHLAWISIAFLGQNQTYLSHAWSSGPEEACSRSWLRGDLSFSLSNINILSSGVNRRLWLLRFFLLRTAS